MKLPEFPQAIAHLEEKLFRASHEVEVQTELLSFMDREVEAAIAKAGLKNEQHRKAKRLELQQEPDYLEVKANLKEAKEERERLTIQLNLLRNQFSVAKLEIKWAIASMESAA